MLVGGLVGLGVSQMQKSKSTTGISTQGNESNIQEKIEQLAALKEQGLLSEEEFEQKKQDLLSRL